MPRARTPSQSSSRFGSLSGGSESDEEDDPVVRELPVFYAPKLVSSLTLLQYPDRQPRPETAHPLLPPALRPDNAPDSDSDDEDEAAAPLQARLKPVSQHLELDVPIERTRDRFDDERGKELATGVIDPKYAVLDQPLQKKTRGAKRPELDEETANALRHERDERRLQKITYASSVVPDITNYLVGVVKEDGLHLSPVTQTFQMRPKLTYLDNMVALERRRKREAKIDEDADSEGDISDTEIKKEEAKAVQMTVKANADSTSGGLYGKGGSGPGNGRAGAELFAPLRAEEGESWTTISHYHAKTPQASVMLSDLLVSEQGATKTLSSTTLPKEYLDGRT
ncbi:hypothetical protein OIV83_000556 [Microbotryomycetes sp. JL201]|nr:hypothetical protein OIV83_000556 [Microbotryomycetes sp. JL201]